MIFTHQNPLIVFLSKVQSIVTPLTIILKNARVLIYVFMNKLKNVLLEKYHDICINQYYFVYVSLLFCLYT